MSLRVYIDSSYSTGRQNSNGLSRLDMAREIVSLLSLSPSISKLITVRHFSNTVSHLDEEISPAGASRFYRVLCRTLLFLLTDGVEWPLTLIFLVDDLGCPAGKLGEIITSLSFYKDQFRLIIHQVGNDSAMTDRMSELRFHVKWTKWVKILPFGHTEDLEKLCILPAGDLN